MSQSDENGFKFPYLPFTTFKNLIEKAEREGIPDRIDRHYLDYTSGIMQSYLIACLKSFELIDSENRPTPTLERLVENPNDRPRLVGQLLRQFYVNQMALPNNATAGQLAESFDSLQGETKRKAITFFLHAARYAGIELSPHFKSPRPARSGGGGKRGGVAGKSKPETPDSTPPHAPPPAGTQHPSVMEHTVQLRSGGRLTVSLHDGANIFTLNEADEEFVLSVVRGLREYESASSEERSNDVKD